MRAWSRLGGVVLLVLSASSVACQHNPAWTPLEQGNDAFVRKLLSAGLVDRRPVSDGQRPPVSVVSCSDSRVAPEVIFNQAIGQVFIVRTAGNVVDQFPLASLEYAAFSQWTRLIVVMGHESCGAIHSALTLADDHRLTDALKALVEEIRKSFRDVIPPPWDAGNAAMVRRATELNARRVAAILRDNPLIRQRGVEVVAAYYELSTGRVTLLP